MVRLSTEEKLAGQHAAKRLKSDSRVTTQRGSGKRNVASKKLKSWCSTGWSGLVDMRRVTSGREPQLCCLDIVIVVFRFTA
jgi:hypothetical protein